MPDNIQVRDANATTQTVRTTEVGGVHVPHHHANLRVGGTDVGAGNPVPVSGPLAAALATDAVVQAIRDRLPSVFATPGLLAVDTLGTPGVARQLAAGAASANTALTTTCRRVSMHARGADIRFAIGTGAQTATATSHFIAAGERLDLDVPASAQIAVIRAGSTDGVLEISELT